MSSYGETDRTAQISEFGKVTALLVELNGFPIRAPTINDIQIDYGGVTKKGIIAFTDSENVGELSDMTKGVISISYTDALENSYSEIFYITKVVGSRGKKNILTTVIYFEDVVSQTFKRTYLSFGYTNTTLQDVIKAVATKLNLPMTFVDSKNPHIYESLVVPKNISFYDWIQRILKTNNKIMYQSKLGVVIADKDTLDFANLGKSADKKFIQGAREEDTFNTILEFNGATSEPNALLQAPPTDVEYVKDNVLSLDTVDTSIETVYESQSLNGSFGRRGSTIANSTPFIGRKTISSLTTNLSKGIDNDFRDVINGSQNSDMIIHGQNINRLYKKIDIVLDRAPNTTNAEGNEVFSGTFVVVGYSDRIIMGVFTQKLILKRSDFGEGNANVG